MVMSGLALVVSLAVLAIVLFGPVLPRSLDRFLPAGIAGGSRHVAAVPATPKKKHAEHVAATDPKATSRVRELPFEEHLAPREPVTSTTPSGSFMRAKVEPAPTPMAAAGPVDTTPEQHPVPGDSLKGPRMVVVIDDIGDHPVLAANLMELPFPVTLAILPNRPRTQSVEALATHRGVEIILHQPMQPTSYPRVNPGPGALFTDMDTTRIERIVDANLAQVPHVVGINNHMGSALTSDASAMEAVMTVLRNRKLFFMDSVTSASSVAADAARRAGVHYYRRSVFLDNVRNVRMILGQLKAAERHALKTGRAIAIGHPYGETLEALKIWAKERDSRIEVVTLSELGPEF